MLSHNNAQLKDFLQEKKFSSQDKQALCTRNTKAQIFYQERRAKNLSRGGRGVVCIGGDVAGVGAVRELDEALLAPGDAPRVAHLPVGTRRVDAHSLENNGKDF